MKLVFISNFFNHHQKPLSDNLYSMLGKDYTFIETAQMSEERIKFGWGDLERPLYVKYFYENDAVQEECKKIINQSDAVIAGSESELLLKSALKYGSIVFRYSERPIKDNSKYYLKYLGRFIKWHMRDKNYKTYLLCASAFAAYEYSKFLLFRNRAYKWGYFPQTRYYNNIDYLINTKEKNSILWVARFLKWKHPELAIEVARKLRDDGFQFILRLIGNGEIFTEIETLIKKYNLQNSVQLLGAMKQSEVRTYMEKSEIFLFTSDHNEGWGAVLNEAMNSGCAVVANARIGSVPFLVKCDKNGLIYDEKDTECLYQNTKKLLIEKETRLTISKNAYYTITEQWNAEQAAKRLLILIEEILKGTLQSNLFIDDICSKAPKIQDTWFANSSCRKMGTNWKIH